MAQVGNMIADVLDALEGTEDPMAATDVEATVLAQVKELCTKFPIYK